MYVKIDYTHTTGNAYVGFRMQLSGGEYTVDQTWLTVNAPLLPLGWQLIGDTGLTASWSRADVHEDNITLTSTDGEQTAFTKAVNLGVTSWVPPATEDDIVALNADGTVTVHSGEGLDYLFATNGALVDVTQAGDDLKPAGARPVWQSGSTDPSVPLKLTRLEDRVLLPTPPPVGPSSITRAISLAYQQNGIGAGTCPTASGFATPPDGMLCRIDYPDGTSTRLFYDTNGLLVRVSDPGDESAAGLTTAPEGRQITDFTWSSGKLAKIYTPLSNDRINAQAVAGQYPSGAIIATADLAVDIGALMANKPPTITLPRGLASDTTRPQTSFTWNAGQTLVAIAGITGTSRTVTFDAAARVLADTDAVGRTTTTTWAAGADSVYKTDSGGRTSSTKYDSVDTTKAAGWHPTDQYGPAPTTCFTTAYPYVPNGTCTNPPVPHTHTDYDHNLAGLRGTYWSNPTFAGTPAGHSMAPGSGDLNYSYLGTAAPAGVTASGGDNWAARYTGLLNPPATGSYTVRLRAGVADTASLYINDILQARAIGTGAVAGDTSIVFAVATTDALRIRVDLKAGVGDSSVWLTWKIGTGAESTIPAAQVKPGFYYATRTTVDETTGSTQVPASYVTDTRYDEGIDPSYGLATSTIQDPAGLALKTKTSYEAPGAGSLLRRTFRTLPAYASAAPVVATSANYGYWAVTDTAVNPCITGSTVQIAQAGMLRYSSTPAPATGAAVKTETIYDALGRPVATRYNGDTVWACTTYDTRGRMTQSSIPLNSTTAGGRTITTNYAYGGDPFTKAMIDPAGTLTTAIDALGRTRSSTDTTGTTTNTTYDQAGRVTSRATTTPDAVTSTMIYSLDSVGRLLSESIDGQTVATATYTADTATLDPGVLAGVAYPNGTGQAGNGTQGAVSRDSLGRVTGLGWTRTSGGGLITSDVVSRSLTGKVLTDTIDGATTPAWSYSYDSVNRLKGAVGSGHNYQYAFAATGGCGADTAAGANSNRTGVTDNAGTPTAYCYDPADRLTSTSQTGYSSPIVYDSHGNTTDLAGDKYTYDYSSRHLATANTTANTTVGYSRDVLNRIVSRTTTTGTGGGSAPFARSAVGSWGLHTGTSSPFTSGSFVPPANSLLVVAVAYELDGAATSAPPISITSSSGLGFAKATERLEPTAWNEGIAMFTATVGASPVATTLTVTNSATVFTVGWEINAVAYTGYDVNSPVGVTGSGTATAQGQAYTLALSGASAASSEVFAALAGDEDSPVPAPVVPGAGWTELSESASYDPNVQTQVKSGVSTGVAWTMFGSQYTSKAVTAAIEIRAATGGTGSSTTVRYAYPDSADNPSITLNGNNRIETLYSLPGGVLLTKRAAGNVWSYPNIHGDVTATCDQTGVKQGVTTNYNPDGTAITGVVPDNAAGSFDYGWLGQHQRPLEQQAGIQPSIEMGARIYSSVLARFLQVDPIEGGTANSYAYVIDAINDLDLSGEFSCRWCRRVAGIANRTAGSAVALGINAALTVSTGSIPRRCKSVKSYCVGNSIIPRLLGSDGFTMGGVTYCKRDCGDSNKTDSSSLIRHEYEHVKQFRRGGLGYMLDYLKESVTHGYCGNKYEKAAYAVAGSCG